MAVETYEQVPYQSKPYRYATAARLAVIARLFGMSPVDPRQARVLEIGCAGGGNLIPRALANPAAEYVGIDPAENHVGQAHQLIYALGATNVRIEKRRVEDLSEADGTFDYIIAHGVYSWVPEPTRRALLLACRRHLRPQGVAYISYNTFPGWHMRAMVRDAMLFHVSGFEAPQDKIKQARAMLRFLAESAPDTGGSWQRLLADEGALLDQFGDDYLFHDHLSPDNEPVYVHQFVAQADEAGLAYLGEAEFPQMMTAGLPPRVRATVDQLAPDLVRAQQYMDFVLNRSFRQSLLVHSEVELERTIPWTRATGLWVASRLGSKTDVDLSPGVPASFVSPAGATLTTSSPSLKAGWRVFMRHFPEPMAFDAWIEAIRAELERAGLPPEQDLRASAARNLLHAYAQGLCELWPHPIALRGHLAARPRAFAFARLQAIAGAPWATNLRHEPYRLDALDRHLLALCDGTRDRAMLLDAVVAAVDSGELLFERDGIDVTPAEARDAIPEDLNARIDTLGRLGVLVAEGA